MHAPRQPALQAHTGMSAQHMRFYVQYGSDSQLQRHFHFLPLGHHAPVH